METLSGDRESQATGRAIARLDHRNRGRRPDASNFGALPSKSVMISIAFGSSVTCIRSPNISAAKAT